MVMLSVYLAIALLVSFLCSIAEAVLLSVTTGHVRMMEQDGHSAGPVLAELQANINKPLAAILSLNTIAHTVGAAGVGAQAVAIFGDAYLGLVSAILTVLILVFSEIIPKSLGAHYWRGLSPAIGYFLKGLVWVLYPLVKVLESITGRLVEESTLDNFSRAEFTAMADLGAEEGKLEPHEFQMMKNLLLLRRIKVSEVMTPRTVIFSLPQEMTLQQFVEQHENVRFSRIPIYEGEQENIVGFVLRSELLMARAQGKMENKLVDYRRDIHAVPDFISVARAFKQFIDAQTQFLLVVDEYGGVDGIITLEDMLETLIGEEIVDEGDVIDDMQRLARIIANRRHGRQAQE